MAELFRAIIYQPLANALATLVVLLPSHSLGWAVVVLTIVVRLALVPLSWRAARVQRIMQQLQPRIQELRERYHDDREALAREVLALYREHRIHPLSFVTPLLVQLPVMLGLFWVFQQGATIDPSVLYPFVPQPAQVSTIFFGIDLTKPSWVLGAGVAVLWFVHASLTIPTQPQPESGREPSFSEAFQRSFAFQGKYVFPVLFGFIAASLPSALALYFLVSTLFQLVHEVVARRAFSTRHNTH